MKMEWAVAMPAKEAASLNSVGANMASTAAYTARQITVPITLKDRCTSAARFAFLVVPTEEMSAVTQVPMF